jgi:hypothetical protein
MEKDSKGFRFKVTMFIAAVVILGYLWMAEVEAHPLNYSEQALFDAMCLRMTSGFPEVNYCVGLSPPLIVYTTLVKFAGAYRGIYFTGEPYVFLNWPPAPDEDIPRVLSHELGHYILINTVDTSGWTVCQHEEIVRTHTGQSWETGDKVLYGC